MKTALIGILLPLFFAASAPAQPTVSRVYVDTVAPGDQSAYEQAAESYNSCLREHGFKYGWSAWVHETGPTNEYTWIAGPYTWADFDALAKADAPCEYLWRAQASPRLKLETSAFLVDLPELSHVVAGDGAAPVLRAVLEFTLKVDAAADAAFSEGERKIAAAAAKSHWPNAFRVQRMRGGGAGAPDYVITAEYPSWAAYGAGPQPPLWDMVAGVYGKSEADAIRKAMDGATRSLAAHVEAYSARLSYVVSER